MATREGVERARIKRKEAIKKNPLLRLDLGDLVREMNALSFKDSNVLKHEKEVPEESIENYNKYQSLITELNRRGKRYIVL